MARQLLHRGPDASGSWCDEHRFLGHRMLRATPEAVGEVQPLESEDGSIVLVADCRIDNRSELLRALGFGGSRSADVTDAVLILASYVAWGEHCVKKWIGDFAVVIWDSRRGSLFCARDPFGVKPLFYHHAPGRLYAFASEINAILSLDEVDDEIDEVEVARHLRIPLGIDPTTTYYARVRRLKPGHILTVTRNGISTRAYWSLDPDRELRLQSDEEYAAAFRECFIEAVRCRLRTGTPVGAMLSGGLDSVAIACVAADLIADGEAGAPLHGLSAVYPTVQESDERRFIEMVLKDRPIVPHFFEADATSPVFDIDQINRLIGGACWGANLYLNWELYGIAARTGARVVLDGFDGDSTVSHGTGFLAELAMKGSWFELATVSIPYSRRRGRSWASDYLGLLKLGLRQPTPGSLLEWIAGRMGTRIPPSAPVVDPGRFPLLNPEFVRRFSRPSEGESAELPRTEREFHLRKLNGAALLEGIGWLEACAAGRGVEVRLPFCDTRLVRLCLSFPPSQKIRRGWTRYVMRRAMEGILPPAVQWRTNKADLSHGWARAWRSQRDDRIESMFAGPSPLARRFVNPERVLEANRRFLEGRAENREVLDLWRAVSLALWLSAKEEDG